MREGNDRIVLIIFFVGIFALPLSFLNSWFLFGLATWLLMVLSLAVGFGRASSRKPIFYTLAGLFLVYSLLLAVIAWTDRPESDLDLLFGLPIGTAFLVYGIWPLGVAPGVLYFLVFHRSVLPEEKLQKFLADFGHRRQNR